MAFSDVLKKFKLLIIFVLLAGLSVGGYFGWRHYTFLQSPEHYVDKLNTALAANNFEELATLVDFRRLTEDLAVRFLAAPLPDESIRPKSMNAAELAEEMQRIFMDAMLTRNEAPKGGPPKNPLRPLEPFPEDFAKQLVGAISLTSKTEHDALAQLSIHYPRLEKDITFLLQITKNPEWQLTHVANSDSLLQTYIAEERAMDAKRKDAYIKQMDENAKRMAGQFIINSCFAFMQTVAQQEGGIFIVRVKGYNKGPQIIRNMTIQTTITGQSLQGEFAFKRSLHSATRILPGVDMEDSYTLELDPNNPEDFRILQGHSFTCDAIPTTMTLGSGEFLFVHTSPEAGQP